MQSVSQSVNTSSSHWVRHSHFACRSQGYYNSNQQGLRCILCNKCSVTIRLCVNIGRRVAELEIYLFLCKVSHTTRISHFCLSVSFFSFWEGKNHDLFFPLLLATSEVSHWVCWRGTGTYSEAYLGTWETSEGQVGGSVLIPVSGF